MTNNTNIGSYKGVAISPGTQDEIRAQMEAIDAGQPITPSVSNSKPIGELFTGTGDYSNLGDIFAKQARGEDIVDTSKIRSEKLAGMQDRINALNQIYADQLARVKQVSAGNVGSGTAILANRGLAGSLRGEAIRTGITTQNTANEAAVDTAKNMALGQVYEAVDQAVNEEAQRRREAMTSGAKNYIEFIKGQDERIKGVLNELGTNYAITGQDPSTDPNLNAIAKRLGVTPGNIIAAYKSAKYAFDTEAAKSAGAIGGTSGNFDFSSLKLSTGQKNDIADMLVLQKQITGLENLKKKYGGYIGAGFGASIYGSGPATSAFGTRPGAQDIRNTIGQIKGFIAKLRGGTSFTPNEQALLDTYTPRVGDSDSVIESKLKSLTQYINDKIESTVMVAGGTYNPQTSSMTATSGILTSPDGKQEVSLSDLTPAEIEEAKAAGWQ